VTKPKDKKYKIIKDGAYWKGDEPVDAGTTVTLTKREAEKLLHRGIIEETQS